MQPEVERNTGSEQTLESLRDRLELISKEDRLQRPDREPSTGGVRWNSFNTGIIAASALFGLATYGQPLIEQSKQFVASVHFAPAAPAASVAPIAPTAPNTFNVPSTIVPAAKSITDTLAIIPGLSTTRSEITGVVDAHTLTASYYWTFVVHNDTAQAKEAIIEVGLPHHAAVTRATLWQNGVAQEAAFTSQSQAQRAYDWVVVQHRDPLLVTQPREGVVKLQASPVQPGSDMQFRIGITVPMQQIDSNHAQLSMPRIVKSNMESRGVCSLHLTSPTALSANDSAADGSQQWRNFLLRGIFSQESLSKLVVTTSRENASMRFATRATHSNPPAYIEAKILDDGSVDLTRTTIKPKCTMLDDDDAAFRLSNLWARTAIQQLVNDGQESKALEIASVYRVISPVSGAVILERSSDYDSMSLDRNRYKVLGGRGPSASWQPTPHPTPSPSPVARRAVSDKISANSNEDDSFLIQYGSSAGTKKSHSAAAGAVQNRSAGNELAANVPSSAAFNGSSNIASDAASNVSLNGVSNIAADAASSYHDVEESTSSKQGTSYAPILLLLALGMICGPGFWLIRKIRGWRI